MLNIIHGSASGATVGGEDGRRTFLHRYELVGEALVRRSVAERRPRLAREVRLVDVLIDDGPEGRSLRVVRGIALDERDLAGLDGAAWPTPWREFAVADALVRAIADDLGARPVGRPRPRLVAVDGARVG